MYRCYRPFVMSLAVTLIAFGKVLSGTGPEDPVAIRVLVFSGMNNHDWLSTTPELLKVLEKPKRFTVDVTENPAACDSATFARYDVIVSNWSAFPNPRRVWGSDTENAFLDFVSRGGGFVLFHAASATLGEWPAYKRLAGSTWGPDTGHGPLHAFPVRIDKKEHPVMHGIPDFWIVDELWHRTARQANIEVLASAFSASEQQGSGEWEPVALTTRLDKGRCFNLVLGHDAATMRNPGWQILLQRAVEWAATGNVALPAPTVLPGSGEAAHAVTLAPEDLLTAVSRYTFGQDRRPLRMLELAAGQSAVSAEARQLMATRIGDTLRGDATLDGKKALCRQLSVIGGAESVPLLTQLLAEPDLFDAAVFALERIPGNAADDALRTALANTQGLPAIALINALGHRRVVGAIPALTPYLARQDPAVARAAVIAMGKIGGTAAVAALMKADGALLPANVRPALDDALLSCAARMLKAGLIAEALPLCEKLYAPERTRHIRMAAFPGWLACQGDKAGGFLIDVLTGSDPGLQEAAVRGVVSVGDSSFTRTVADLVSQLPRALRPRVVTALGERGDSAAETALLTLLADGDTDATTQHAIIGSLAAIGGAASAAPLARLATRPGEQQAARHALARLSGTDTDAALIAVATSGEQLPRIEAINALGVRRTPSAIPALLGAARSADGKVAQEALKALGRLGSAETSSQLVAYLDTAQQQRHGHIKSAIADICMRDTSAARHVGASIARTRGATRMALVAVLGRVGDPATVEPVMALLKEQDSELRLAAVRALATWPNDTPLDALLTTARAAQDRRERILAIRGIASLVAKAETRTPQELTGLLTAAFTSADTTEEKKALLGALAGVRTLEAMDLAACRLDEPELADEAGLAVMRIAETLWPAGHKRIREALQKTQKATQAPAVMARMMPLLLRIVTPVNLAPGATASSPDGLDSDGAASGDQAAIDGDPATYWDEVNDQPLYRYRLTFKAATTVSALKILPWGPNDHAPKDFEILCDDSVVMTVEKLAYETDYAVVSFPPTTCRTLELRITGYYPSSPAIRELEIYHPDASQLDSNTPVNLALHAVATSPDDLNGDGASSGDRAAIDGNPETYWDEVDDQRLYRLRLEFKAPCIVSTLRITGHTHHLYAPRDFEIVCDGEVVHTVEGAIYDNNVLTVTFPETQCESLDLHITGYYGKSPAIRELEVYDTVPEKRTLDISYRWQTTETTLALMNGDRVVWQANFDPKQSKPSFHPLALTDGTILTWMRPADHVWHRALWFSWKYINGLNYWEEDPATGRSQGLTELVEAKATPQEDHSALLELTLSYHPPGKPSLLNEKRSITVGAPDASGAYRLDWKSVFTAQAETVELNRTPLPGEPGGAAHGGYAGLSLRASPAATGWIVQDSEGRPDGTTHGKPARWVDYAGPKAGVTIFDHPDNPRYPTKWFLAKSITYCSPAFVFGAPYTLQPGEALTLHYGVLVHPGRIEPQRIEQECRAFADGAWRGRTK